VNIGVISDTHGSLTAWVKAVNDDFSKVDLILHGGDVLYHGPRNPMPEGYQPADLSSAMNSCPVPILICRGNCDSDIDQQMLDIPIQSPYVMVWIDRLKIMVLHGDGLTDEELGKLAERYRLDILITAHTHIHQIREGEEFIILNPGSPSLPKGDGRRTIGLIDSLDKSARIIDLENGNVLEFIKW
jgi:putative phosphoesterase